MKYLNFYKLVQKAGQETIPQLDVSGQVMHRLTCLESGFAVNPYRPLMWMLSFSSAVAACITIAAILMYRASATDSAAIISDMVSWAAL